MRQHHPAPLAFAPPQPQQFQQLRREHGVAVPASLALLDADQHACRVDVVDLEVRDLGHAQTRANTERGLVLDAWRRFEQSRRILNTQHLGQLARISRDHERARQIPPLQRHREQEAERRDWKRRISSGAAVSGARPRKAAKRRT
jgi:hypothetical protein